MPAALSLSTPGTMALGSNGASTMASGLLRTTSSISPSCSAGVSLRGMKCTTCAPSDWAAISLPVRTPRRMGLAGLRVKVPIVSAWADAPTPRTVAIATMQAFRRPNDARFNCTSVSRGPPKSSRRLSRSFSSRDDAPATALIVILILAGNQRERAQGRTGSAADLQRRDHQQELVDARIGQFLEEIVLDDVDAVVGDQKHVHREHLELRRTRHENRRALLERQRVGADRGSLGSNQELGAVDARPGRVGALVPVRIGAEKLTPSGADEDGVARLQVDLLGLGGALEMLRRDLELIRQRREVAVDEASDVQHHAAGDEPPVGIMGDVEVGADTAAADATGVRGGGESIDAAEQFSLAADVADGVDAGRAMLAAELLDLRGERELAVAEGAESGLVRGVEEHAVGRVDGRDRRVLVPHRRQVEDARAGHVADELAHLARSLGHGGTGGPGRRQPGCRQGEAANEIAARQRARVVIPIVTAVMSHGFPPLPQGSPAAATRGLQPSRGGAIEKAEPDWPDHMQKGLLAREGGSVCRCLLLVVARLQCASGSGRIWKCTASGFEPLPPSRSHGVRSPLAVHRPRPFQPPFGSSMRPSKPLA